MIIDLIANDGSPIGVTPPDIYGKGVGGAELAMMSLMQTFAERGHDVRVFNDPKTPKVYDGVNYLHRKHFKGREKRDALIVFRSPSPYLASAVAIQRIIWWSCDQYTIGSFKALSERVDFCVTISPFHTKYHMNTYGIPSQKMGHVDLGVRLEDYSEKVEKIPGRMVFCSVPDRGLKCLHAAWPLIKRHAPSASLIITSDYRLWGVEARVATHRLMWAGADDVTYLGKVPRTQLIKLQKEAEVMPYPCTYDELFCISVAEAQVAGAFPVTSMFGALPSTNEFGIKVSGNPTMPNFVEEFAERAAALITKERQFLEARRPQVIAGAKLRFDWNTIAKKWEHLIEKGKLPG